MKTKESSEYEKVTWCWRCFEFYENFCFTVCNDDWQGLHGLPVQWWVDRVIGELCILGLHHQEKAGNSKKYYDKNGKHIE